jgi:hypothetical protein
MPVGEVTCVHAESSVSGKAILNCVQFDAFPWEHKRFTMIVRLGSDVRNGFS